MTTDETRDQSGSARDLCSCDGPPHTYDPKWCMPTRKLVHFAPYSSTNAACDETVPRGALHQDATHGLYSDPRFTEKRSETTCQECRWRAGILPGEHEDAPAGEQQQAEFRRASEMIDRMFGWKHLSRYGRMSEEWMDRLRDGIARAITSGHLVPAVDVAPSAPSGPALIEMMPPSPETNTVWYSVYCRECGIEEGLAHEKDSPMLIEKRDKHNVEYHSPAPQKIHEPDEHRIYCVRCGVNWPCQSEPSKAPEIEASNRIAAIVAERVERTWPELHPVLSLRYGIADAVLAAFPEIATRASRRPHIADEAVQKLRGLGLHDTAISERLAQATMLAAAPVSDELVQVTVRIAAKATVTSADLHLMERGGIRVTLPRGPAPVDEAKLAEVIAAAYESDAARLHGVNRHDERAARAVLEYLDSLR